MADILISLLNGVRLTLAEAVAFLQNLPWKEILDSGEKGVKSAAIIAAGIAGYYRFLRGRVFRPRLEMTAASSLLLVGQQQFLKVTATLKNTGASRIVFDLKHSALRIFAASQKPREIVDSTAWEQIATVSVSGRHSWIEPAETVYEHWLITLPATATNSAFRSELRMAGAKTAWYADTIVERQPLVLSTSPKENNQPKREGQEMSDPIIQTDKDREEDERIRREIRNRIGDVKRRKNGETRIGIKASRTPRTEA